MSVSRVLLPPDYPCPDADVDTFSDSSLDSFATSVESPTSSSSDCQSTFQAQMEACAKAQIDAMLGLTANLVGYFSCVFNPRFETSIYDSEDQDYHYPVVPDYQGKLLIVGLAEGLRFAGEDQWSPAEIALHWNTPQIFDIKENAKIVVNYFDQKVTLRSKTKRRKMGQFRELVQIHQLVPFN
jgi:hypothetical protein